MPHAEFETVPTAAHDTGQPVPFLRVTAPEPDAMMAASTLAVGLVKRAVRRVRSGR